MHRSQGNDGFDGTKCPSKIFCTFCDFSNEKAKNCVKFVKAQEKVHVYAEKRKEWAKFRSPTEQKRVQVEVEVKFNTQLQLLIHFGL